MTTTSEPANLQPPPAPKKERNSQGETVPCTMREFLFYFLRLGTFGFGGPIALAGHMPSPEGASAWTASSTAGRPTNGEVTRAADEDRAAIDAAKPRAHFT